jgi:choline dehydrogenase-like flavoprotein
MRDFDGITDYALRNLYGVGIYSVHEEVQRVELLNLLEQVPNPDSRLTLSDETDALGQRRLKLDWRFTELDWRTLRRSHEVIGMELGKGGLGRFRMDVSEIPNEWPEQTRGAHHHMGTTRMHDDPKQGVTDGNCRVHGVANLWIAGSSVFPTGGYANPTLTLVALAIRLADKLKESMA